MNSQNAVVINATNIGYRYHGIGTYSINLIKELTNLSTNLSFIIYANKSAKPHIDQINLPGNFRIKWITGKVSPDHNFKGHLLRLFYSNLLSLKYRNNLILNTSQLEISFFSKNQVVMIHDVIPLLFYKYHKKQFIYYKYFLGRGLKSARLILTPSQHSKDLLKKIYNIDDEKIKVIHNGAGTYLSNVSPSKVKNEKYIIYIGRICRMKNIEGMLKAYALIAEKVPHKFIIVGDDKDEFERIVNNSGLSEKISQRIIFKQQIPESEKRGLLNSASLMLYPSLYEGFGLPPIEAMACGCPVVVSDNSSLPEICGDAAIYVKPDNYQDIADGILRVIQNPGLYESIKSRSLLQAAAYQWKYSAARHLELFETIVYSAEYAKKSFPVYAAK